METEKIVAYAMAYLEIKISEHEKFLDGKSDKENFAQYQMLKKYKRDLNDLEKIYLTFK